MGACLTLTAQANEVSGLLPEVDSSPESFCPGRVLLRRVSALRFRLESYLRPRGALGLWAMMEGRAPAIPRIHSATMRSAQATPRTPRAKRAIQARNGLR